VIFGNSDAAWVDDGTLGFSITSPFKSVAHAATAVGKGVAHGTVAAAKGAGGLAQRYGKTAAELAVLPVVEVNKAIVAPVLKATVLRPVISRINTLKDRRAKKLAWDNRKSTTPTPQERSQASSWTKSHLRSQAPPLGLMMSVLAGSAPQMGLRGLGEPTTATITAAVPALIALLNSILKKANSSGDAPEHVGGGSGGTAAGGESGAPDSGSTASDGGTPGGGKHGARSVSSLPLGLTKKQLTIGGAVLGGVVLLALLTRK